MVLSIVKRIISPGCQQDYSVQLIQKQGCKKSEACRVLAINEEFYTDCLHDLVSRDAAMLSMGKIIVELAEHVAATKHDANTSKAALTRRSNKFVQKYEKYATEAPRSHNFISTSNDPENLADPTGNRRWMPVDVCETREQIDTGRPRGGVAADLRRGVGAIERNTGRELLAERRISTEIYGREAGGAPHRS